MHHRPLNIAVIDAGRVGLSGAIVLAQKHHVVLQDECATRVHQVNAALSPYDEPDMALYLEYRAPHLRATLFRVDAVEQADLVFIATPTLYDEHTGTVDTGPLDHAIRSVCAINAQAPIVIESTVPVGYTLRTADRLDCERLIAAPALLRPRRVMHDRLNPARIVVGEISLRGLALAQLLQAAATEPPPAVFTDPSEAEAIQLFAQKQLLTGQPTAPETLARYAERHRLQLDQLQAGLAFALPQQPSLNEIVNNTGPRRHQRLRFPRSASGQRVTSAYH